MLGNDEFTAGELITNERQVCVELDEKTTQANVEIASFLTFHVEFIIHSAIQSIHLYLLT